MESVGAPARYDGASIRGEGGKERTPPLSADAWANGRKRETRESFGEWRGGLLQSFSVHYFQ